MKIKNTKIAIVHDWFLKKSFGGAENVTKLLDGFLTAEYSMPDIFSLTSNIENSEKDFVKARKINTSFIQSLPFGKTHVQNYLPLLPFAIEQINLSNYELIISSSHAVAKGIITSPYQLHISYIHTPMRYAWDQMFTYLKQSRLSKYGFSIPISYALYKLREWDFMSSQRVDCLISNSSFTAKRIKKYWGRYSEVINPPVNVERFSYNLERDNFYLSVNRLVPNKRIDILIKAFNKLALPLIIVGDGPERYKLQNMAYSNVKFYRNLPNSEINNLLSRCRAFVYAGIEDFGIAPVEALASGAPVIAYGKGGILDSINCFNNRQKGDISTGILFKKQTASYLIDTIKWFEEKKLWRQFDPELLNNYSHKFSYSKFKSKFDQFLNKAWDKFQHKL